jgi:hypothetical protein
MTVSVVPRIASPQWLLHALVTTFGESRQLVPSLALQRVVEQNTSGQTHQASAIDVPFSRSFDRDQHVAHPAV